MTTAKKTAETPVVKEAAPTEAAPEVSMGAPAPEPKPAGESGTLTTPIPETADDATPDPATEEPVPGLPDIFMQVHVPEGKGNLRVREEPSDDGAVTTHVPHNAKLRVLDNENPDWVLVELTDGSGAKGFVKRPFVAESE